MSSIFLQVIITTFYIFTAVYIFCLVGILISSRMLSFPFPFPPPITFSSLHNLSCLAAPSLSWSRCKPSCIQERAARCRDFRIRDKTEDAAGRCSPPFPKAMQTTAMLLPLGRPHGWLAASLPPGPVAQRGTCAGRGTTHLPPLSARGRLPCGLLSLSLPRFASPSPPLLFSSSVSSSLEVNAGTAVCASASGAPFPFPDEAEKAKLAQVCKRLENTSRYFKRLGGWGFWSQLVCTVVAAVILSFSAVITGNVTSPATFYSTSAGIAAAFISVFWSFGYIRLSERLRRTAGDPSKAPPRAEVVKSLRNGIVINLLGMGAAVLGMQATVGLLVAKALTTSAVPYYQGIAAGRSPVLALDVFLVQASANTILSHFLGLLFSLELLRSVTLPQSDGAALPRAA